EIVKEKIMQDSTIGTKGAGRTQRYCARMPPINRGWSEWIGEKGGLRGRLGELSWASSKEKENGDNGRNDRDRRERERERRFEGNVEECRCSDADVKTVMLVCHL
ncbi:hypothetical protein CRG98_004693, partial [Punica granatum]